MIVQGVITRIYLLNDSNHWRSLKNTVGSKPRINSNKIVFWTLYFIADFKFRIII